MDNVHTPDMRLQWPSNSFLRMSSIPIHRSELQSRWAQGRKIGIVSRHNNQNRSAERVGLHILQCCQLPTSWACSLPWNTSCGHRQDICRDCSPWNSRRHNSTPKHLHCHEWQHCERSWNVRLPLWTEDVWVCCC